MAGASEPLLTLSDWIVAHDRHDRLRVHDRSEGALSVIVDPANGPVGQIWDIQLLHRLPALTGGQRYALRFRASGTYGAGFHMKLTLPEPPWTWIEQGQLIEVGPHERAYDVYFAPSEDLPNVQLQLDLAGADGSLHMSELRLVSLGARPRMPEKSYMICATPRSGSSWLASLFWNTGAAGRPAESFLHYHARKTGKTGPEAGTDDWNLPRDAYLARARNLGMTANGVFGTKMMLGYLDTTASWLGQPLGMNADRFDEIFQHYFPGLRYLHLYRRDKVDQAVSMFIASETDAWRAWGAGSDPSPPPYDAAKIREKYDLLVQEDAEWTIRLSGLPGFAGSIAYEDLRTDFSETIKDVFAWLDLHPTAYPRQEMTSVTRQASPLKAAFSARFKEEMGLLTDEFDGNGKRPGLLNSLRRVPRRIGLSRRDKD